MILFKRIDFYNRFSGKESIPFPPDQSGLKGGIDFLEEELNLISFSATL
jgi:hypothetical protein